MNTKFCSPHRRYCFSYQGHFYDSAYLNKVLSWLKYFVLSFPTDAVLIFSNDNIYPCSYFNTGRAKWPLKRGHRNQLHPTYNSGCDYLSQLIYVIKWGPRCFVLGCGWVIISQIKLRCDFLSTAKYKINYASKRALWQRTSIKSGIAQLPWWDWKLPLGFNFCSADFILVLISDERLVPNTANSICSASIEKRGIWYTKNHVLYIGHAIEVLETLRNICYKISTPNPTF